MDDYLRREQAAQRIESNGWPTAMVDNELLVTPASVLGMDSS
jgi:hypothetical protein